MNLEDSTGYLVNSLDLANSKHYLQGMFTIMVYMCYLCYTIAVYKSVSIPLKPYIKGILLGIYGS